jgi:O-antigen/teichoic acid export membrane protein
MPRLLGEKYTALQQAEAAGLLSIVAAAVPALFLNSLVAATLIADARAWLLPWLTVSRVALASVLAFTLIPRFGLTGAGTGLVIAEWLLLGLGVVACRRMGIGVPVLQPLGWAVVSCAPMALVVLPLRHSLPLALAAGVVTWLATLALAAWLAPAHVRQLTGDFRYP